MRDLSELGGFAAEAIMRDSVPFVAWQGDGRIVTANPQFFRLTGYPREEAGKMAWPVDFFRDDQCRRMAGAVDALGPGESAPGLEGDLARKDGSRVPVMVFMHRFGQEIAGGSLYYAFIVDVAAQKEMEDRFRLAQHAVDHFMDSSLWLDREGRIVYANEMACKSLGYTREELLSMRIWDIDSAYTPETYARSLDHIRSVRHMELESCGIAKDGRQFPVEVHASYLQYRGHELVICFVRDVTRRKRSEEALKESEEKFRVLAELSPAAIFLYQGEKLVYANSSGARLTGFSTEEMLTKNFWDMIHPEYSEMVKRYGLARQRGEHVPTTYDVKYITKGGEERWAEFTAGLLLYKGRPAGIVSATDITDRKLGEIELREAKAQAELYVDLMGHDINNMNQAALGFLEIVEERLATREVLGVEDLQLIVNAMDSLRSSSGLIDSVRKLQKEKKGGLKAQVIDVGEVLADVKKQYSSVPGRNILISYERKCSCRVLANELLKDVFSNIVGNAIKHSHGDIEIGISLQATEEQGTPFCRATVEDTGPGIPDELKRRIFERAGKEMAKLTGKGLGLYLVKTLVDDYHGRVWVEDRVPGDHANGSRFVVLLPATQ